MIAGKPEGKRRVRTARSRCVDNIKIDVKKRAWEGLAWINVATNKGRWPALVNTVMTVKDAEFLDHLSVLSPSPEGL
jgi:sensor domain CHASE-containing protein